MNQTSAPTITFYQAIVLSLGIPLLFLSIIELGARGVEFALKRSEYRPQVLEMPTWMMNDSNHSTRPRVNKDDLEWLNLFTEGDGFRVNLIPNVSAAVKNTFSLIPVDAERRRSIKTNSIGFRGPEIETKKPEGTFRILVFGDSSSFGWGVNDEESWSALLAETLSADLPNKKIEVGNFAIPGDSSAYGRLLFEHFAPQYESDLVILGFGANDAKPVFTSHTSQVSKFDGSSLALRARSILRHSAIFRLAERALGPKPLSPEEAAQKIKTQPRVPAVSAEDYSTNMSYMVSKSRELGNRNALLITLCTPGHYAREAKKVAESKGALWFSGQSALLKLIPSLKGGKVYPDYVKSMEERYPEFLRQNQRFYVTSDGCHPNELGHRFVADRLAEIIKKSGIL